MFESPHQLQLVASVISLATSHFISYMAHRALILLLLAFGRDSLRWIRGRVTGPAQNSIFIASVQKVRQFLADFLFLGGPV